MMGTGGDEALTGYYEHFIFDLVEKYKTKHFKESKNAFEKYISPKLINPHLKNYKDYILNPNKRDHLYPDIELFSDCLKSSSKKITTEKPYSQSILRNRMLNFLFHQGVRFNLSEIDMNSMYHSVENRAPLLDHKFLEYSYTIPNHLLIKDGYAKSILRDAMQGIAPNSVLQARDKHSLNVPLSKIYNLRSKKFAEYLFEDNVLEDIGLFKTENIKKILNTKVINNEIEKFLFRLINVKEFCQICG
jgi:asparagine synthase (glutamine-hydrolysing)